MCNVRYEYMSNNNNNNIDESLLEKAFERKYIDYLGFSYKCKLCNTIIKSALDAWLHLRNYHNIKTLDDYKAYEELRKNINETIKQQEQNDKVVIKKVVRPRHKTLMDFLRGGTK
jgi:hypothetical protein